MNDDDFCPICGDDHNHEQDNCDHRFVYVGTGHPPPRQCEECGIDESETL